MFPEFCTYMASVNDWGSPMPADDRNLIPPLTPEEIERRKALPEAAQRALAEADARKAAESADAAALPEDERGGPSKIEPTRFGDWERKGIAYDF